MDVLATAVIIALTAVTQTCLASSPDKVYFSLIVSYGEFGFNSSGAIPAVNVALEYINRSQILPGYELTYERARNSQVQLRIS